MTMTDFNKSNKPIYNSFFAGKDIIGEWIDAGYIHRSLWHGEESKNSFCLKKTETYRTGIRAILEERFGIMDKETFREKYLEAISGDGQEWTRITTLHSSSLAALLCFYSVCKGHELKIDDYTFDESFFEVKTQVYGTSESNMDVVLRGKDGNGETVTLFLECKFSEYLDCGEYSGISKDAYLDKYEELGLFDNPIDGILFKDGDALSIAPTEPRRKPVYCGGIKQMLSHYIGVSNYSRNKEKALGEHSRFKALNREHILLGEILFDFGESIPNANEKLKNYSAAYSSLAEIINGNQSDIEMLPEVILYNNVFDGDFIQEENIRKFYGLGK